MLLALLSPLILTSCFTGVESTPKINYREEKGAPKGTSAEEEISNEFRLEPFSRWENGKAFYVTSPRISLALSGTTPETAMPTAGDTIIYLGNRTVTDLTGDEIVELRFRLAKGGDELIYRTNSTPGKIAERGTLEVPFTIDLSLVKLAADRMRDRRLYIKTNLWSDLDGNATGGRKFVEVTVTDVLAGNEVYPLKVVFADEKGQRHAIFMSAAAGSRWAPREFPSLFSLTDPRLNYPQISDAVWQKIINSRVDIGMTKLEATLALGSPANIDRGHDHSSAYERWRYSDGVYLIFEDGLLTRHNQ